MELPIEDLALRVVAGLAAANWQPVGKVLRRSDQIAVGYGVEWAAAGRSFPRTGFLNSGPSGSSKV